MRSSEPDFGNCPYRDGAAGLRMRGLGRSASGLVSGGSKGGMKLGGLKDP